MSENKEQPDPLVDLSGWISENEAQIQSHVKDGTAANTVGQIGKVVDAAKTVFDAAVRIENYDSLLGTSLSFVRIAGLKILVLIHLGRQKESKDLLKDMENAFKKVKYELERHRYYIPAKLATRYGANPKKLIENYGEWINYLKKHGK